MRAQTQAYKEQTRRLEAERLAKLEAKTFELASTRLETEFEHVERLMKQEREYQRRLREAQERAQQKQKEAEAALERKDAERRERNQLVSEALKTKQELRDAQRKQNERKEEYNRKILRDKIQRDKERMEAEKEEKEAILRERRNLWAQKAMERELFERAAVSFQKTGVLKKPPGLNFDLAHMACGVHHFDTLSSSSLHLPASFLVPRAAQPLTMMPWMIGLHRY